MKGEEKRKRKRRRADEDERRYDRCLERFQSYLRIIMVDGDDEDEGETPK